MSEMLSDPAEAKTNEHHCVPRSFLGSNDRNTNVTVVQISEHNAFHGMAGHRPPASFLRKTLLSSINWHDGIKMLPAGLYRDLLPMLTPHAWQDLYQPGAVRNDVDQGNGRTKAAVHVYLHLCEEQKLVADAIGALGISRYMSRDVRDFMNDAMLFFHTDTPTEVMRLYLTDKNPEGDCKWAKPLLPSVHSRLCDLVKGVRLEEMRLESRKQLLGILENHNQVLHERSSSWRPTLEETIDAIAEYGQSRMGPMITKQRH